MTPPAVVAAEDLDGEHSNEYGDEGFESDVPRSRPSRDDRELASAEKGVDGAAVLGSETGLDDTDLQISASSSDAGTAGKKSAPLARQTGFELAQEEQELNKIQTPHLVDGENGIDEEGKGVAFGNAQESRAEDIDKREGGETGLKERDLSFRVPTDGDGDNDDGAREYPSLDMNFDTPVFSLDDDRNPPPEKFLGRTGSVELSSDLFSPQPFGAREEEFRVGDGVQLEQQSQPKPNGDRCKTRGRPTEQDIRGARSRTLNPRNRSKERDGRTRLRASSQSRADAGGAASIRRQRQERLIQQLTRDNGVLQRKVAGYQLAIQLSADEDDFSTSPSFSAAMQLQQAAPPAFPRGGGTPAPSPRVARGWTHRNPPPPGRISPVERNLSYTTLVRQLDMGGRQARMLKRENEALGARVNELESGAVLRATQSRLSERDEEIVALREELSVMNRLARAQDRKFEGCHGYALARRLWLTEEELRTARSTISTLGAEVYGLRQLRKTQSQDRRPRSKIVAVEPTPDNDSNTRARQLSPRRPLRRRRASYPDNAAAYPRSKPRGQGGKSSITPRGIRSPTTGEFGPTIGTEGSIGSSGRVARSGNDNFPAVQGQEAKQQMAGVRAEMLQRALANMRKKAKGELEAARVEIDGLKEDKAVLTQALETKAREIRMQLLQVNRLKRELQHLSAGAIKLEEASCVVAAASLPLRARGISSAAAAAGETSALAVTKLHEGRAKSAVYSRPALAGGVASINLLDRSQPPPRPDRRLRSEREPWGARARLSGQFSPMGWDRDWGGDGAVAAPAAGTGTPDAAGEGTNTGTPPTAAAMAGEVVSGALGRALSGLQADEAAKNADSGDGGVGGVGVKLGSIEGKQEEVVAKPEEVEDIAAAAAAAAAPAAGGEVTHLHPCPLAGIMDMSEPPLRSHRRSYYNEDDGKVYNIPRTSDGVIAAELTEVPREDERSKCVVDFQGIVRHGEGCALSKLAPPSERGSSATSRKQSLNNTSVQGPDQERLLLPGENPMSIGVSVRTWHRDNISGWDPTGEGTTARLPVGSQRPHRKSSVSLSEGGRLTPTINLVRRPTHFSVESVREAE